MKRILYVVILSFFCICIKSQVTTFFRDQKGIRSNNEIASLRSLELYDNYTYVTIELIPIKNLSRLTYFTSRNTYILAGGIKLSFLGALSNDKTSYHSCSPDDNWGWDRAKKGQSYYYTLVFKGRIPAGITTFSLIDDYSYYHGYSFKNYTINNPSVNSTSLKEADVKQNIDANNDGFCGIYEGFGGQRYRLGCIKQDGVYYLIYLGSEGNMSWWKVGDVKAVLRPSSTIGLFKANWYMADKSINTDAYIVFDGGSMKTVVGSSEDAFLKMYPMSSGNGSSPQTIQAWSGTGFALNNGYIITNNHVVEGAQNIFIYGVDGDFSVKYTAKIIEVDKKNDLALVRIKDSRFAGFGNIPYRVKTYTAEVGEDVFVLGYPLTSTMGDEVKLTTGIISAKTGYQGDVTIYQISAPIQPGNSGGPLFDDDGNIIGVVVAKHTGAENVGYAIKSSYLRNLVESAVSTSILPTENYVSDYTLTEKVRSVKNFVFMISCSK